MFTGIIETTGIVEEIRIDDSNMHFTVSSDISHELKIDQSIAHDGVCLTVVQLEGNGHTVTAINETLARTTLRNWKKGSLINLERCMPVNGRFDGHIVQGHVDTIAICKEITDRKGSWIYCFEFEDTSNQNLIVEKGSITINGISLTVVDARDDEFTVAIIPYTLEHTNLKSIKVGNTVNIEFDIIGKYIARNLQLRK